MEKYYFKLNENGKPLEKCTVLRDTFVGSIACRKCEFCKDSSYDLDWVICEHLQQSAVNRKQSVMKNEDLTADSVFLLLEADSDSKDANLVEKYKIVFETKNPSKFWHYIFENLSGKVFAIQKDNVSIQIGRFNYDRVLQRNNEAKAQKFDKLMDALGLFQ